MERSVDNLLKAFRILTGKNNLLRWGDKEGNCLEEMAKTLRETLHRFNANRERGLRVA